MKHPEFNRKNPKLDAHIGIPRIAGWDRGGTGVGPGWLRTLNRTFPAKLAECTVRQKTIVIFTNKCPKQPIYSSMYVYICFLRKELLILLIE